MAGTQLKIFLAHFPLLFCLIPHNRILTGYILSFKWHFSNHPQKTRFNRLSLGCSRVSEHTLLVLKVMKSFNVCRAQLFSTNAFSVNKFSLNVLSTSTAIYSQSIVNTNIFFTYFCQRKQTSRKWRCNYYNQTNSFGVIRLEVLGLNVLVLISTCISFC